MSFAEELIKQYRMRGCLTTAGQDLSGNSVEKSDTPLLFEGNGASRACALYRTHCHRANAELPYHTPHRAARQ